MDRLIQTAGHLGRVALTSSANSQSDYNTYLLYLNKLHKPKPIGRPIISGCEGQTERILSFVDRLLQPIAYEQKSYIMDTKDLINFVERTKIHHDTILVSMDVTSL